MRIFNSRLIIFFGVFFVLFWQLSESRRVQVQYLDQHGEEHILSLSLREKKRLYHLMEKLFAEDSFAYTVLGRKPLSWATYRDIFPITSWETFIDSLKKYHRDFRVGWKTWEKYSDYFPKANLRIEKPACYPGTNSILIVNPKHFNAVVMENKTDFQEALNREILDGYELLEEAQERSLMHDILNRHQALLGIVLGYGKENSWKFLDSCKTRIPLACVWGNQEFEENLTSDTTRAELLLTLYSCPYFAGDPNSEESIMLKDAYLKTRDKVLKYYKGKDFLEATLSLLAGYRPSRDEEPLSSN